MRAEITKSAVDNAPARPTKYLIRDTRLTGFCLKVMPTGTKVYLFRYRLAVPGTSRTTSQRDFIIGTHGEWTPAKARKEAEELAAKVRLGIDPIDDKRDRITRSALARAAAEEQVRQDTKLEFRAYVDSWLDEMENVKHRRLATVNDARWALGKHVTPKLAGKSVTKIGRADIQSVIDAIPADQPSTRRNVFAYASSMFGWAEKRGDIPVNLFRAMEKPVKSKSRERVLSDTEIAVVWTATMNLTGPYAPFYRFLLLTGKRRAEVGSMGWNELDRAAATWTIPADRAKNHTANIVPLSDFLIADLDALARAAHVRAGDRDAEGWPKTGWVMTLKGSHALNSFSRAKRLMDAEILKALDGNAPVRWTNHDLRRTLATGFQKLGVQRDVTRATLNHVTGGQSGLDGIYQLHDWKDEKRDAAERWHAKVVKIVAIAESGNVVAFDQPKRA